MREFLDIFFLILGIAGVFGLLYSLFLAPFDSFYKSRRKLTKEIEEDMRINLLLNTWHDQEK